jgi:YesN/AraC family two-component response regulator
VIITDLGMPFVDGRQVARILKAESPTTPVIMLTGWGAFMKADGDLPGHVDRVLSKPPRAKELRKTLSQLVSRMT